MPENFPESDIRLLNKSLNELEFFGVLEYIAKKCYSKLGKQVIMSSYPTDDFDWLENEHKQIEEMIKILTEEQSIPFENFSDIKPLLYKSLIQNSLLSSTDLLAVADTIQLGRLIKSYFLDKEINYPTLSKRANLIFTNRLLEKHIKEAIEDSGEIKDNATKELSRIRKEILQKSNYLRHRLDKMLHKFADEDMVQEEFVTLREGRFVLPIRSEHKRHLSGIIHGVSQTGATVYIEPTEIIELNNDLSLLLNEEKKEIYRILSNLTAELGSEAKEFLRTLDIIAHLDSIIAKANYALEFGGIKPIISEENEIILKKIRHPLLVQTKGSKKVVPLSIEFNKNKRGHLISGPNAGGKTVALKSIGLNIIMALSGIFPFGECKTNFRMIYTSIGDHQSIEHDLSTFSSQIIQIKEIISSSDLQSLILIDEIGSGTDPQEGSALAAGILDTLIELNSFFVATTHNSALKSYALSRNVIDNASLEFNENKLIPTYKFLEGVPGNSYAFQLANSLGLPKIVLERAKSYLGSKQSELEESISLLNKYKSEAEKLKTEANLEKVKAEELRKKYGAKFSEIKRKRDILINQARSEANEILKNANALIEKTIKDIKENKKSNAEIKKQYNLEKENIKKQIKVSSIKQKQQTKKQNLKKGDTVAMEESNSSGTILEIYNDTKTALVEFNDIKFKLPLNQLSKTKISKERRRIDTHDHIDFNVKSSIDIRGKRAYEAISEVDEFISKSIVAGISPITIIHGKGTGALRHSIQEYLDNHHSIKSYRSGNLIEGGDGVTIAELSK